VVLWGARREATKVPKKGHSKEKILRALHQAEGGEKVADICREHGISEATFYVWKKKYAGLALSELRELRQLREENGKLKRLVATARRGIARAGLTVRQKAPAALAAHSRPGCAPRLAVGTPIRFNDVCG
jgi:putative transposase